MKNSVAFDHHFLGILLISVSVADLCLANDDLVTRIQALPSAKLNQYRMEAAKQLQQSLIRCFQGLSTADKVPPHIRTHVKKVLVATQQGKFTQTLANNIHIILQQASEQQQNPAQQLQVVLQNLVPAAPAAGVQEPLQGLLGFLQANLDGVNTLLSKLLGGAPDLLSGVIKSLQNNLGAVTDALNGSLQSLGALLGGALG